MPGKKPTRAEIAAIEARMKDFPEPDLTDPGNPELTAADFAKMRPASELPPEVLAQFPNTKPRGRPRPARPKQTISMRLDAEVLDHLRSQGPGGRPASTTPSPA